MRTHDEHIDRVTVDVVRAFEGMRVLGWTDRAVLKKYGYRFRPLAVSLLDSVGAIVHEELERINGK